MMFLKGFVIVLKQRSSEHKSILVCTSHGELDTNDSAEGSAIELVKEVIEKES